MDSEIEMKEESERHEWYITPIRLSNTGVDIWSPGSEVERFIMKVFQPPLKGENELMLKRNKIEVYIFSYVYYNTFKNKGSTKKIK